MRPTGSIFEPAAAVRGVFATSGIPSREASDAQMADALEPVSSRKGNGPEPLIVTGTVTPPLLSRANSTASGDSGVVALGVDTRVAVAKIATTGAVMRMDAPSGEPGASFGERDAVVRLR
jgi:hypothetical protein